jgi:hypothetical protein
MKVSSGRAAVFLDRDGMLAICIAKNLKIAARVRSMGIWICHSGERRNSVMPEGHRMRIPGKAVDWIINIGVCEQKGNIA